MRLTLSCALWCAGLACLLLGADRVRAAAPAPALSAQQLAVEQLVEAPDSGPLAGSSEAPKLRALYVKRNFLPLWTQEGEPTAQASALLRALRTASEHGLRAADYEVDALAAALKAPGSTQLERAAAFDVRLSLTAARFLTHLHQGRVDPKAASFELRSRTPLDHGALLTLMASSDDITPVINSVEPPFNHYQLLLAALKQYQKLAAQPGLTRLPQPKTAKVRLGQPYAGAGALRKLLHAVGDLSDEELEKSAAVLKSGKPRLILDAGLVKALKRFQLRHGLPADGQIDAPTYTALTTPFAQRVRQIELTLERWRWLPPFETPPIIVNIPQFRLFAFRSTQDLKQDILQMDVIVGQSYPEKQTPVFAADMRFLILRPYWEIPRDILVNELLPKVRQDPKYLESAHLQIVQSDTPDEELTPLPATPENLDAIEAGTLRLRQEPGPDNALGLIKFMFPNAHDVYLHSTPAHALFKETRRDFSHGCIRVSDPVGLAVHVLRDTPGDWTREKVEEAMKNGDNNLRINLAKPIRVYVLYGSAMANQDGSVQFFDDIYGHDQELETLLQLPPVRGVPPAAAHPAAGAPLQAHADASAAGF